MEEHEELARSLGVNALVDQIHSSAVDLMRGTGMDRAASLQALEDRTRVVVTSALWSRGPLGTHLQGRGLPRIGP